MRKIKFRGKRVGNGEWVEGDLIQLDNETCIAAPDMWGAELSQGKVELQVAEVIPETVGQFTGIHDKDGKEIWEGDIVESEGNRKVVTFEQFEVDCCGCCYESHRVVGFNYLSAYYPAYYANPVTVLGNIHDNPELLKPQDNDNTGI